MPSKTDLLEEARQRFKLACDATAKQAERELEDLKFQVPEEQWTEEARRLRRGDQYSPGRPTLSISKIDQPIQIVENEAKNARLGVEFHPVSEDAGQKIAEVKTGLYRRIERDSNAQDGRMWAFGRALRCGTGYYMVSTKYDEDSPDTWDQEIVIDRILYQESVKMDPAATKPDCSDGRFAFITTWMPRKDFEREFPDAKLSKANSIEWENSVKEQPEWVTAAQDKKGEGVQVAWYWYKDITTEVLTAEIDDEKRTRKREVVKVYHCKINGSEIVEGPTLWPSRRGYIPIIPVIGRELQPYDGERRRAGMIYNVKDAQRAHNFAASSVVERMQAEPKMPYIGATGQFEGHEKKWETANFRNHPYLEYNQVDVDGKPAPPPQRAEVSTQGMSVAMAMLQESATFIHDTMQAGFDPSIGRIPARERSGRAIKALQEQLQHGTSNYIGDFARNAMNYEAKVIDDLMPAIYDRPGRIVQVLGEEGDSEPKMLNQPFRMNPDTGRPEPVAFEVDPMTGEPVLGPGVEFLDLSKGSYTVTVSVGRSHESRLAEGREEMSRLLEAQPELWPLLGPTFLKFEDAPWAKEASDILRKYRDKKFPGLTDDDEQPMTPEATRARLDAAEDYIKQLQQHLQEAQRAMEIDQAKQQATMQKAQLDALTKLRTTEMQAQADLQQTRLESQIKVLVEEIRQRFDAFEQRQERTHETKENRAQQAHETAQKESDIQFGPAQGPLTTDDTIR